MAVMAAPVARIRGRRLRHDGGSSKTTSHAGKPIRYAARRRARSALRADPEGELVIAMIWHPPRVKRFQTPWASARPNCGGLRVVLGPRCLRTGSPGKLGREKGRQKDIVQSQGHAYAESAEQPMKVDGKPRRSIWLETDGWSVGVIDQTRLPHQLATATLTTLHAAPGAVRRCLALGQDASEDAIARAYKVLLATRPTAINLKWALDEMVAAVRDRARAERMAAAYARAAEISAEDIAINQAIGRHGLALIEDIAARKKPGEPVNILTHCNAGWLAPVDVGTVTAPIYTAHDKGVPVYVWDDETRPRTERSALTAWDLDQHGVAHHVIPANTGGALMQRGLVDMAIVGADRVARNGDVCNKIGTYLKALAARDNA